MSGELVAVPVVSPVAELAAKVADIREQVMALAEAGDWEGLVRGLVPMQQMLRELRDLESLVKQATAECLPSKRVTVEGVGTVERRAATQRKRWDSDELLRRLVFASLVDENTGEMVATDALDAAERVHAVVSDVLPITGSLGWRVGALRERGVDPDEWCEVSFGAPTVQVTVSDQGGK